MNLSLWVAQGFGLGRIPFAPGTFGSLGGVLWFAFLLGSKSAIIFTTGIILSIALAIWTGAQAEKILREKDPGSVVIDEIVAVPLCFAAWLVVYILRADAWPSFDYFVSEQPLQLAAIFVAFRFFDITKPWPVRRLQDLPGGWGVVMDDLMAAVYVNALFLAVYFLRTVW